MLLPSDVPFELNGSRHFISYHTGNHTESVCRNCDEIIAEGDISIGLSKKEYLFGVFFWLHLSCVTTRELKNIWSTYRCTQMGKLTPVVDVLRRIPGFLELSAHDALGVQLQFKVFSQNGRQRLSQSKCYKLKSGIKNQLNAGSMKSSSPRTPRFKPTRTESPRTTRRTKNLESLPNSMNYSANLMARQKIIVAGGKVTTPKTAPPGSHFTKRQTPWGRPPKGKSTFNSNRNLDKGLMTGLKRVQATKTRGMHWNSVSGVFVAYEADGPGKQRRKKGGTEICGPTSLPESLYHRPRERKKRKHSHVSIKYHRRLMLEGETTEETEETDSETEDEFWDIILPFNKGRREKTEKPKRGRPRTSKTVLPILKTHTLIYTKQRQGTNPKGSNDEESVGRHSNVNTKRLRKRKISTTSATKTNVETATRTHVARQKAKRPDTQRSAVGTRKRIVHSVEGTKRRTAASVNASRGLTRASEPSEESEETDSETEHEFWELMRMYVTP